MSTMKGATSMASPRPALRHVIFDLDSTLSDSLGSIAETRSNLLKRLRESTPAGAIEQLRKAFRLILVNDVHDTEIVPKLRSIFELSKDAPDDMDVIHQQFLQEARLSAKLLDGGEEVLTELALRNVSMVLWSNKRAPFVVRHVENLGIGHFFRRIYCQPPNSTPYHSADKGLDAKVVFVPPSHKKPSPEFLHQILQENSFEGAATLFVGNNVNKDGGSTVGTSVRFAHANFDVPTAEARQKLFELTGSEKLSFVPARNDVLASMNAAVQVDYVLEANLMELLHLFHQD